ncbi:hypothetical protein [Geminisphaera colitermitum]|uniref:hypothetical protein n=1 Tax=Geminisphaera colitermitum TaxID=1148786 RepID=UPI0012FF094E|nr:hypothetical protein [Geminisphaera colitermitum]
MTAKAKATIKQFHSRQFALRDKVAARSARAIPDDRLRVLVSAGILTRAGKLTSAYRPGSVSTSGS